MTDGATAWRTLAAHFRDRITSGELKSGVQLPTETQMQHVFEVSRTTTGRAVAELSHEGWWKWLRSALHGIERRRGPPRHPLGSRKQTT